MPLVYSNSTIVNATVVTTAETAVWQTSPASARSDQDQWAIEATIDFTTGTGTTGLTVRCRRGTGVLGTQVGASNLDTIAAGNSQPVSVNFTDTPGAVAGQIYTITVQQTAATANGTVVAASGNVMVGQP